MKKIEPLSIIKENENRRFDATFFLNEGRRAVLEILNTPFKLEPLGDIANFNLGPSFRRNFIADRKNGVPFVSATSMLKMNPEWGNITSVAGINLKEEDFLQRDLILLSKVGTIGKVLYTDQSFDGTLGAENILRIRSNSPIALTSFLYAFLASSRGQNCISRFASGNVIQHISASQLQTILVPIFPIEIQRDIDSKVNSSCLAKEKANGLLIKADNLLHESLKLSKLRPAEYDIFGVCSSGRPCSKFVINESSIEISTLKALNYSEKNRALRSKVEKNTRWLSLREILDSRGVFKTRNVKRIACQQKYGIRLLNQSDLFDTHKVGKFIAPNEVVGSQLVEYGEILLSGVGSITESAIMGRVVFAGDELVGALLTSLIYRIKPKNRYPSGYLYTWLASDYGFRLLRGMSHGNLLSYINKDLLLDLPVPIPEKSVMEKIDQMVQKAFALRNEARLLELSAIDQVEKEIEKWQS